MIREAVQDDFEVILDMCERFWQHTRYPESFNREHTRNMVQLAYDHGLLAVIDQCGIVGFIAGVKAPLLASTDALNGTELAWWVEPEYRKGGSGIKLMRFIEKLARKQGVKYWNMISMQSSSPGTANKIYERLGYIHSETSYTKVL